MNPVRFTYAKLNTFIKRVATPGKVQVGVLSQKPRTDGKDNATIGLEHEMGVVSARLPQRSFLMMPLEHHLKVEEVSADVWLDLVTRKNSRPLLDKLGDLAENTIQTAFDTGGFGQWQGLSQRTINYKGNDQILVDTSELRSSIAHRVV